MKYFRVMDDRIGVLYIADLETALDHVRAIYQDGFFGTKVQCELVEMTEEEYDKIPELFDKSGGE